MCARAHARSRSLLLVLFFPHRARMAKWWPIMSLSFFLSLDSGDSRGWEEAREGGSYARGGLSRIPPKIMIGPRNWRISPPRVASSTLSSTRSSSLSRVTLKSSTRVATDRCFFRLFLRFQEIETLKRRLFPFFVTAVREALTFGKLWKTIGELLAFSLSLSLPSGILIFYCGKSDG